MIGFWLQDHDKSRKKKEIQENTIYCVFAEFIHNS